MNNLKRYTLYILNAVDILSMILAYFPAYFICFSGAFRPIPAEGTYDVTDYRRFLLIVVLAYVITNILFLYKDETFLKRNGLQELVSCVKVAVYTLALVIFYFFFARISIRYSRIFLAAYAVIWMLLDYIVRILVKKIILPHFRKSGSSEKVVVVASSKEIHFVLDSFLDSQDWRFYIVGIVLTDQPYVDHTIRGIPVLSDINHYQKDLMEEEFDSVLIVPEKSGSEKKIREMISFFRKMGRTIQLQINEYNLHGSYRRIDQIGDMAVLVYYGTKPMPKRQVFFKRILDVLVSIVLLPLFFFISLLQLLFNVFEASGPVLMHRVRVGKNGRRFYLLRYRVYRMDAVQRLADGKSPYTFFGKFLHASHLDGLPQILNVLSNEMSIVGPEAVSVQQYLKMPQYERSHLSVHPGIVGYWSCHETKQDYLKDEQEYIGHWTVLKDLSVLLTMFLRYLTLHSTRVISQEMVNEEFSEITELQIEKKPYVYDKSAYQVKTSLSYKSYLFFKRLLDILLSAVSILVLLPLFAVITILVIADDGGSPFYGHHRIGKNGKRITVYKFRSMRMDAGNLERLLTKEQLEQYQKEFKITDDPRITKIGKFLRKTSLDELPQLFNILGGSLSFVGPRPITEEELVYYGKDTAKLLSVKPGLTGYWQAYARNEAAYATGKRQDMEMYYVDHQNMWMDIRIFFHTFGRVFSEKGAE